MHSPLLYLWFENWTRFISVLDEKAIPHGGFIIKVRASITRPPFDYNFIRSDGSPFTSRDTFTYPNRGTWSNSELTQYLNQYNLEDECLRIIRALFRFANRPDLQFCANGMQIKRKGHWLITHPLQDIDGWDMTERPPTERFHLDIFEQNSLVRLLNLLQCSTVNEAKAKGSILSLSQVRAILKEGS